MTLPFVCESASRYRGYRVPSARLPGFDYGHGVFFFTVVTKDRVPWFGRVQNGHVELADAGRIVWDEWARTADLRSGVTLDAFVVMPDHVHGVIVIRPDDVARHRNVGVETPRGASLPGATVGDGATKTNPAHRPEWRPDTLGAIVNHFKGACTRRIRATAPAFAWQSRFYDVIVRDRRQLEHIRRYIAENPSSWR